MCMGSVSSPPPPVQQAPQITPPVSNPDGGLSGQNMADNTRRRAMSAAGLNINISTSPLGTGTRATTTRSTSNNGNLLG